MAALSDRALIPPGEVETPCLVVDHAAIRHNLTCVAEAAGGIERLFPHVKTHRAPWIVADLLAQGVRAVKTATPAEVEMVLAAGAREVLWAFPSMNAAAVNRVLAAARDYPEARLTALIASQAGADLWRGCMGSASPPPIGLSIDLDPDWGRSGIPMGPGAKALASNLMADGLFAGWHLYDGHLHDPDRAQRAAAVADLAAALFDFLADADPGDSDVVVGCSYTFDLWPIHPRLRLGPGGWVFSSLRHTRDLPHHGWRQGAYVMATAISACGDNVSLDAGVKSVGSDIPLAERFHWPAGIESMSEEHSVISADGCAVGERVLLTPGHACTTAYVFSRAWVRGLDGGWEIRPQLGVER